MMGTFDSDTSVSTAASAVTITYDSPTPMNGPTFQSSPAQIRVRTLKASDAKVEEAQSIARTIIMNAFTNMDPDASMSTITSGISDESFMPMDGPVLVPVPAPVHVPSDVREQEAQLVMPTTTADMGMDPDTTVSSSASAITIVYSSPTPMNGAVFEPPATPSPAPHLGDASDALQSPESWRSSPLPRPENRLAHYDTSGGSSASEEFPMDGFGLTMSSSGFSVASYTNDQFSAGMGRTSSPRNKYRAPRSTGGVLDAIDTNLHSKDEKSIKKKKTNPTGRLRGDTCKGGKENWLAVRLGGN
ncbi:hypothetical protein BD779DRAFT_1545700 [Infundibulicybe gibba]|nr:hypothetical protein BD779DRAFT_1545700 [Infundibulicybe gibba]